MMEAVEKAKIISGLKAFVQRTAPNDGAIVCTVKELDEVNNNCYCEPIGDHADIYQVRFIAAGSTGLKVVPLPDSVVLVSFLEDGSGYISMFSEIKSISWDLGSGMTLEATDSGFVFNGGALDGMVKLNDLVAKLNTLENKINDLITAIAAWAPVANDGGAALKAALTTWLLTSLTPTVNADLENTDIKQ